MSTITSKFYPSLLIKIIWHCIKQLWTRCISVVTYFVVSYYRFLNTDRAVFQLDHVQRALDIKFHQGIVIRELPEFSCGGNNRISIFVSLDIFLVTRPYKLNSDFKSCPRFARWFVYFHTKKFLF
jgi:hypothetical protein